MASAINVSVVIVTRNRGTDAIKAAESALCQKTDGLEVLIYDDASSDESGILLRQHFSDTRVRIHAAIEQRGYIHWRNQGFRDALGHYVFSLDDDALFTDENSIQENLRLLETSAAAFAVAIPFVEPFSQTVARPADTLTTGQQVRSYIGCSHLVRRKTVLDAGGYRELLVHQTEERDLCLRMLENGYTVIYGTGKPVVHLVSPRRDTYRLTYFGFRNTLLVTGLNVPWIIAIPRMAMDSLRLLRHRFSVSMLPCRIQGISAGWLDTFRYCRERRPVSIRTFRAFCRLPLAGPMAPSEEKGCEDHTAPVKDADSLC